MTLKTRMTTTLVAGEIAQYPEVDADDDGDEHPEQDQEATLLQKIGLAGLPDQLGDLPHGLVGRQSPDLVEDD